MKKKFQIGVELSGPNWKGQPIAKSPEPFVFLDSIAAGISTL